VPFAKLLLDTHVRTMVIAVVYAGDVMQPPKFMINCRCYVFVPFAN
jgi:hypothetical protein